MSDTYSIRFAEPGEGDQVASLLRLARVELESQVIDHLNGSTLGGGIRRGLRFGLQAMREYVQQAIAGPGGLINIIPSQAGCFVAVDVDDRIKGAVYAVPPGVVLAGLLRAGSSPADVVRVAMSIVRIKAIAVLPETRSKGLGKALLNSSANVYEQLGYKLIYGTFFEELERRTTKRKDSPCYRRIVQCLWSR